MRPVLILKKFNLTTCLIVPITGQLKNGAYYFPLGIIEDREGMAIISQIRCIDQKRLTVKIRVLNKPTFLLLLRAIIRENFSV